MDEVAVGVGNLFIQQQHQVVEDGQAEGMTDMASSSFFSSRSCMAMAEEEGVCAICLDRIELREVALVKGCEHAYCVNCILRWATYNQNPICPQCKNPFKFLIVHRALDGSVHDYMSEESVCLLLRANWFEPLTIEAQEEVTDEPEDFFPYQYEDEEDDDIDEFYYSNSSSVRIGNRRWGSNGYVRAGRKEARPINRESFQDPDQSGPSRSAKKKEVKVGNGRRAKRAMKREAADKAAAASASASAAAAKVSILHGDRGPCVQP